MALNLTMTDEHDDLKPRITVFGVGGAGGNAVNNMIDKQLEGVTFVVANTDAQALAGSRSESRIQMGPKVTEGLGAGAKPAIGAKAAEETIEDIVDHLMGAHMCFITAGMGGGTGTGAAPIIAQAAREMGILTVGVVTKPFQFEGSKRMRQAEDGVEALQKVVDTLIIIPNQNLFRLANEKTTFTEAFAMADDVLYQGVKGVTDLMVRPGLINLDFADVRAVMDEMGKAMMGTGEASGDNRAVEAAERAIANPLLDEISLNGAKGVLINITGGHDMTLFELDEAANIIRDKVDQDANIIVGSTLDPDMEGKLRVSVVATGIDAALSIKEEDPAPRRSMAAPLTQNPPVTQSRPVIDDLADARTREDDMPVPPRRSPAPVAEAADAHHRDVEMPGPGWSRAAPAARSQAAAAPMHSDDPADFVAPHAAAPRSTPGTPRPEALERLAKLKDQHRQQRVGGASAGPLRPQAAAPQQHPADDGAHQRARMGGLGRMLERMTGHTQGDAAPTAPRPTAGTIAERVSERVATRARAAQDQDFDDLASPDSADDNVEIPAFLRRQAN